MIFSSLLPAALLASSLTLCSAWEPSNATTAAFPFPSDICAINAWPTGQPGVPLTAQLPDNELQEILAQIDPVRIRCIIEKLVSYGTRHTMSSQTDPNRGIGAARDWLLSQYQEFAKASGGMMTVALDSYIQPVASRISAPTNISNIVATLKGSSDPSRIYVVRYVTRSIRLVKFRNRLFTRSFIVAIMIREILIS
jgi:hypothetical protein